MISIYHNYKYTLFHLSKSFEKSAICFKYLKIYPRMKSAYVFYFQFRFYKFHSHMEWNIIMYLMKISLLRIFLNG